MLLHWHVWLWALLHRRLTVVTARVILLRWHVLLHWLVGRATLVSISVRVRRRRKIHILLRVERLEFVVLFGKIMDLDRLFLNRGVHGGHLILHLGDLVLVLLLE